jgi:hypothetical protein
MKKKNILWIGIGVALAAAATIFFINKRKTGRVGSRQSKRRNWILKIPATNPSLLPPQVILKLDSPYFTAQPLKSIKFIKAEKLNP